MPFGVHTCTWKKDSLDLNLNICQISLWLTHELKTSERVHREGSHIFKIFCIPKCT